MPGAPRRGVFLSYRRDDAGPYARSLQLQLSQRVPDARIFMDLDSIEPGLDFAEVIEEAVNSSAVLVVLIGRQWATLAGEDGVRRLDNADDYVRFEVKTALEAGVRVIPVLIDGAKPLRSQDLPPELHKLARLNAAKLSFDRYQQDADRLLDLIQRVVATVGQEPLAEPERKPPDPTGGDNAGRHVPEEATRQFEEPDSTPEQAAEPAQSSRPPSDTAAALVPRLAHTLTGHKGGWVYHAVHSVAFSPDGRLLASGSDDKTVQLWDPATGEHIRTLGGHSGHVMTVAFSPNGQLLASGSEDKTVQLCDPATGEHIRTLGGHGGHVTTAAFSPDGRLLATGSHDHLVQLWDPATGKRVRTLGGHTGYVETVAFSPDGRLLASGSYDKTVRLWDPATGNDVRTLTGHGWVKALAFSPDGRLLATGNFDDTTVRLWDPATGEHMRTLTSHTAWVSAVAFSADGRLLATGGRDKTVQLWDPATGEHLHTTLTSHKDLVHGVAFSPDGRLLATGGGDRTVQLWNLTQANE